MNQVHKLKNWLTQPKEDSASLAFFRIAFGLLMFCSLIRFFIKGWIYDLYVKPKFFFTYYGFECITPPSAPWIYLLFIGVTILTILICIGLFYRTSIILFFFGFTYIELMDKANYLNHYYLISLLSFLMIFLPLNHSYSLDNLIFKNFKLKTSIQRWMKIALEVQVGFVYFFGGIAKLKSDWLLKAQPLKIWLTSNSDLPFIGSLLEKTWIAYAFSWFACIFDLTIIFFLWNKKARPYAYLVAVVFHVLTSWFFYIGMFPFIMMTCALIFFSNEWHHKILKRFLGEDKNVHHINNEFNYAPIKWLSLFFVFQFLFPFRFLLYKGNVLWTEQGYRFSWNIMLMEKAGSVDFIIKVPSKNIQLTEDGSKELTKNQIRQMSQQPDMILEYAHHLGQKYSTAQNKAEVYAESYISFNGRPAKQLINPNIDLMTQKESLFNKQFILPFND